MFQEAPSKVPIRLNVNKNLPNFGAILGIFSLYFGYLAVGCVFRQSSVAADVADLRLCVWQQSFVGLRREDENFAVANAARAGDLDHFMNDFLCS